MHLLSKARFDYNSQLEQHLLRPPLLRNYYLTLGVGKMILPPRLGALDARRKSIFLFEKIAIRKELQCRVVYQEHKSDWMMDPTGLLYIQ